MPAFIVTYALMQAAGSAASAAINAYLKTPAQPSFRAHNGQETLYDEDNWARVLDIQEILHLVQPFISAVQNLDISEIKQAAHVGRRDNQPFKLDEDAPPPYEDPEAYLSTQSYRIIRTTQRLVETLQCAAGGPSGSSPLAWNLNVQASIESGLEVLALYCTTTQYMATSTPGSLLRLVHAAMRLDDAHQLMVAEQRFQPVRLCLSGAPVGSATYHLRLPADRGSLEIPGAPAEKTVGAKAIKGIGWTAGTAVVAVSGPIGWAAGGAYRTWRHYDKKKTLNNAVRPRISQAGCRGSVLSFVSLPGQGGLSMSEKQSGKVDLVHFGMVVNVVVPTTGCASGQLGLSASQGKGSELAKMNGIDGY
ncbi:hypothetical protein P153DRAFT_355481 [Dothidotthia symphoricarpi CBS 119687]|uniref:Uncharacterized protein n=1 Tax=Dothidotthia symphoricarpi CBS 119687 TaxID=1392245 RepID=A0A6A6ALE6_9PLEO|nr:uncharacterized protein P153DRAFT_355481 [Dothidotthia symphoricarpi CBS 119687]KAF2131754.1 hypothetical protein P153DRAFT_355481 [Dothidotthia symphoricarpi CBS 119687]